MTASVSIIADFVVMCEVELVIILYFMSTGRKEQSFQAAVSSWMVQLETATDYKDGLAEALSARCALLIQVPFSTHRTCFDLHFCAFFNTFNDNYLF